MFAVVVGRVGLANHGSGQGRHRGEGLIGPGRALQGFEGFGILGDGSLGRLRSIFL